MKPAQYRYTIILTLALAGVSQADAIHASPRYLLSPEDLALVEAAACIQPHGLKVDRAVGYDFRGTTNAHARCRSHGTVDGQPMHYFVSCVRESEGWRCTNTLECLRARIGSKEFCLIAPRGRMSEAYGAVKYVVRLGKYDVGEGGVSDDVKPNSRTVYHVGAEEAGERALRIQKHPKWLYVERTPDGYREVPEAEAKVLAAQIEEERGARGPVYNYFWAHHTGSPANCRDAFLPAARIEEIRDGKLVSRTSDEYCGLFNGQPAEDEKRRERNIDFFDLAGDTAFVKATLDHGATVLTDYLVLRKIDGKWKIASSVQTSRSR